MRLDDRRRLPLWAVVVILSAGMAAAQTQSQITGTVTDNSGAVIAGAAVTARNTATGVTYPATTNSTGTYSILFLPPGQYELACEFSGFKKFLRTGLVLETGLTTTVDIRLELGALSETVTVQGAAPLLETESSTVGQFIERSNVLNMPMESRRSASLVRLMGNVTFNAESGIEQTPTFSMAGGRSTDQMWHLDGAVVQNNALGASQLMLNPPAESLQEFKAEANNYNAEFGRASGGLIIMTTRSGTNEFHGAAYEFLRNDKTDARTFFAPGKAPLRYNIFGGSVGGPIRRDKTFFFVNYEASRRRDGLTFSNTLVPHPPEINGDFSARRDLRVTDPLNRQPFPDNVIPASRLDPLGRKFAAFHPAPNIPNNDITRAPKNSYVRNVSDGLTQDILSWRVDHSLGAGDRVYGRHLFSKTNQDIANVYPNAFADFRAGIHRSKQHNVTGTWIHNFTSNLINEARFTYVNRASRTLGSGVGSGKNGELGVPVVNKDGFPYLTLTGLTALGRTTQSRVRGPSLTQQPVDNLTWMRGRHQIKTGFEWRYTRNVDDYQELPGGRFDFSDRATGSGLAALLLGWTTSAQLVTTDLLNDRTDYYGAYLQDTWKVTPRFTLNIGLRWDMDTPRWDINNHQSGFDPKPVNPVAGVPGVVTFSGVQGQSKYAHNFDGNNFGPRFGFSWRAADKWVVRGGYGISYDGEYGISSTRILYLGFGLIGSFTSPDGGFTPAFPFAQGMPPIVREPLDAAFGAVRVGQSPRVSPEFFAPDHANGYAQQWNLTVQREVAGNMMLEAAYIANVGHKIGGPDVNLNMIPLVNGRGPERQDQRLRPFPQFNNVTRRGPAWGNSSYHSMNVKFEKRYSNGLNFLMNYTWSKFIDDVQANNELAAASGNGYTHVELRRLDRSLSGNDVRQRFIESAVYELPFGRGRHWDVKNPLLNHLAGGWGIGAIVELRAGAPFGVLEQTNVTNTFSHGQRPNLLRAPKIQGDRSRAQMIAQYFDTSAFQAPGVGVFGNAARNVGIGPGFIGIDTSVHKRWPLTEHLGLQFRTDFYNLPNRANFANPGTARGRSEFGAISSTLSGSTGRLLQFSLRLEF